ncbi:hypothetical protein [Actinomadura rubrisoli]|uniref:RraA family protein n=1 Tax=Actinomadura rubrisoli TaxID=2530368 RepID=UPI003C7ADB98
MNLASHAIATLRLSHPQATTAHLQQCPQRQVVLTFGGVEFRPGGWLFSDGDGIIVAVRDLR